MDCTTFRENMDLLDELLEGRDKSKEIMMVCTGGIRCSISGRYLKQKGFKDVKMVRDRSHWVILNEMSSDPTWNSWSQLSSSYLII